MAMCVCNLNCENICHTYKIDLSQILAIDGKMHPHHQLAGALSAFLGACIMFSQTSFLIRAPSKGEKMMLEASLDQKKRQSVATDFNWRDQSSSTKIKKDFETF